MASCRVGQERISAMVGTANAGQSVAREDMEAARRAWVPQDNIAVWRRMLLGRWKSRGLASRQ